MFLCALYHHADSKGNVVNFRNTIVIFTSNIGSSEISLLDGDNNKPARVKEVSYTLDIMICAMVVMGYVVMILLLILFAHLDLNYNF